MIKIIIATNNAAFEDGYKELESSRIISEAADKVENDQFDFKLRDINGNTVGRLEETDDEPDLEPGNNYIVLEISTDNAAFEDAGKGYECARILREAATKMRDGDLDFKLRDINGNTVGKVEEVVGEEPEAGVSSGPKMALITGNLEEGFTVEAILSEEKAGEAVERLLQTWSGRLAEAIEIIDPATEKGGFEAVEDGTVVVVFGTLSSGIEVFGPFDDNGTAVEFADSYREENDSPYEVFEVNGGPESVAGFDFE